MVLSEREIAEIGERQAQKLIANLGHYSLIYHEPDNIPQGLRESMSEELTASNWYRQRARHAKKYGDDKTAKLYEHIAREEDVHYQEFMERLDIVQSEKRK